MLKVVSPEGQGGNGQCRIGCCTRGKDTAADQEQVLVEMRTLLGVEDPNVARRVYERKRDFGLVGKGINEQT